MLILTVEVSYEAFDSEIYTRLSMMDEIQPNALADMGEYKDFSSMRYIDADLVNEMFHYYIRNTEIQCRAETYRALLEYAPMDPFDNFLIYVVLPVVLDLGAYDLYAFINGQPSFEHTTVYYDSILFRDETIAFNFLCEL